MLKQSKSISINIVSVLIILTCLLLGLVSPTNAWFTDQHKDGILIGVTVGNLNLKLYQITTNASSQDVETEIYTNLKNETNETDDDSSTTTQFIMLDGKISPDEAVTLRLKLKNLDKGQSSMYIKFKFELYIRGVTADSLITTSIAGFTAPTSITKGFVKGQDDYYYYKATSAANAENAMIAKSEEVMLMTSFTVPYSSFMDSNGNMLIKNSDIVYIKLDVEASENANF